MRVVSLRNNEAYESPTTGLRVTVTGMTNTSVLVNIDGLNPSTCVRRAPVVTLSPATSSEVAPVCGQASTLAVQVRVAARWRPWRYNVACVRVATTTKVQALGTAPPPPFHPSNRSWLPTPPPSVDVPLR